MTALVGIWCKQVSVRFSAWDCVEGGDDWSRLINALLYLVRLLMGGLGHYKYYVSTRPCLDLRRVPGDLIVMMNLRLDTYGGV